MTRRNLIAARNNVTQLEAHIREDIGLDVVAAVLNVKKIAASEWLSTNGDPIQEPNASLKLAAQIGIDEKRVSLAAFREQRPDGRLDPLLLAVTMTRILIETVLSPNGSAHGAAH